MSGTSCRTSRSSSSDWVPLPLRFYWCDLEIRAFGPDPVWIATQNLKKYDLAKCGSLDQAEFERAMAASGVYIMSSPLLRSQAGPGLFLTKPNLLAVLRKYGANKQGEIDYEVAMAYPKPYPNPKQQNTFTQGLCTITLFATALMP